LIVRADGRSLTVRAIHRRSVDFTVAFPLHETTIRVTALDGQGRSAVTTVPHVLGLPRLARPHGISARLDADLQPRLRTVLRSFPGVTAAFVQDLTTGAGAAWNARARFPAASTLKVAIAVELLRELHGKPKLGSPVNGLLHAMLVDSSNEAANSLEVLMGGSTSGGAARVTAMMRSLGLLDSEMYGGYVRGTYGRSPIPRRVDAQPYFGRGKHTSANDLARLLSLVHLAAAGKGLLAERYRGTFTPSDARFLLYTLAQVPDRGKLGRFLPRAAVLLHKAGWISDARHDAGLVYWRGGVFVAAVMTYTNPAGGASDLLAGRVARLVLSALDAAHRRAAKPTQTDP
jgi:beta-lactamase class A